MATDNLETPSFNFGIQDTMEMGRGDATLLNDLFAPETATANADDLEPIIKETAPPTEPKTPPIPKGKEIVDKETKDLTGQDLISNFLGNNDTEEEPIEEDAPISKPVEDIDEEDSSEQVTQFSALSKDLFRLGVFSKEDDEEEPVINTPEEFLARFNAEKQKGAIETVENFISQFGEDYKDAFDAIFVKGVNPREYFETYNTIVNFAELDLTNEDNQVKVIKQALHDQGFDAEDIESEVERLRNYGDLETVATKHHKVLVRKEATKLQQMEQKAQQELQQKQLIKNQYIQNVQSIVQDKLKTKDFDGIPLNPKLANELQDFLLVDKYKTASGETLTDFDKTILELKRPENHVLKVKVALLLKILEKDPTLSTIQRSGVTKKSDQLFGEMARQRTTASSPANKQQKPTSWFS